MVPSVSEAVAARLIVAGASKVALAEGAVRATEGGTLPGMVAVSVTLSRPMIWSGEVATALSSTQRCSSVAPPAQAPERVTAVDGVLVTPVKLGTVVMVGLV